MAKKNKNYYIYTTNTSHGKRVRVIVSGADDSVHEVDINRAKYRSCTGTQWCGCSARVDFKWETAKGGSVSLVPVEGGDNILRVVSDTEVESK